MAVLVDRFHLNPRYFPKNTRDLLTLDTIVKHGALALGFKKTYKFFRARQVVNLGFLDPSRQESIGEVFQSAREKLTQLGVHGLQVYQLDPQEFIQVLEQVFQLSEGELRRRPAEATDPLLHHFLQTNPPLAHAT